jgi:hypothetical protein
MVVLFRHMDATFQQRHWDHWMLKQSIICKVFKTIKDLTYNI